jgi:hypothetical protein
MATWDDVASIVGELQLTDERSPHEWRVGKKLIAWERPLSKSYREAFAALGIEPPEGDILGVRVADEGVKFVDRRRTGPVFHHLAFRRLSSSAGQTG